MKFLFENTDPKKVAKLLSDDLSKRELGKMVSITCDAKHLTVTIAKLGTSQLVFKHEAKDGKLCFDLEEEKIAFAHRPFKDDVTEKFSKIVEKLGGKIV